MGVPRKVELVILSIGLGAALSCSARSPTEAPAAAPKVAPTQSAGEGSPSATTPAPKVDLAVWSTPATCSAAPLGMPGLKRRPVWRIRCSTRAKENQSAFGRWALREVT